MRNYKRYGGESSFKLDNRKWPGRELRKAPIWCSVDLRDGNQALESPMSPNEKLEYYKMLLDLGFKEIEVAFPASSSADFDFVRMLIEENLVPDDVYLQVITQCRPELIERTFWSIKGAKNVIFHIYNSISTLQKDVVFHHSFDEMMGIAREGVSTVKDLSQDFDGDNFILEYSPESFTGADMSFAYYICENVKEIWQPDKNTNPMIISLPSSVEMHTPNVYADMVEWMSTHLSDRNNFTLGIHPHNDRGTAIAAAELALLAGAERVEGTLFGNGERTGNVDLLVMAYNMFSRGIDPKLNLENEPHIQDVYERCTGMDVHDRHPYAGRLVFTAFAGSHQDAINKGIHMESNNSKGRWAVPYIPVDPEDIGRSFNSLVRITSQSGKGGIAYIMERDFGIKMPKNMHKEFAAIVQKKCEDGSEIRPEGLLKIFNDEYLNATGPLKMKSVTVNDIFTKEGEHELKSELSYIYKGEEMHGSGMGTGPVDASMRCLSKEFKISIRLKDYSEHSLTEGAEAEVMAYVELEDEVTGNTAFGAGKSSSALRASIRALFSSLNRLAIV